MNFISDHNFFGLRLYYILILVLPLITACNTTKYLQEDQSLLKKIEIVILDPNEYANPSDLKLELAGFYQQEPNTKWFTIPREGFWFRNNAPGDTSWYNNVIKRDLAEEPSIYDDRLSDISAEKMALYLKNIKGFYDSEVTFEQRTELKHTFVQYFIKLGPRYRINSIEYLSKDKQILEQVKSIQDNSELQAGSYIDANLFNAEKQRILLTLQNRGYINFIQNHIKVYADSTIHDHAFDFFIEILPPGNKERHQKYVLGDINVYTDFHSDQDTSELAETKLNDKHFYRENSDFIIEPEALDRLIYLNEGDLYSRDSYYKTIKQLSSLNMYRFANVSPFLESETDTILNYNIALSPQNYKRVLDYRADLFYTTVNNVSGGGRLIGVAIGGLIQDINAFGGGEVNTINTELGVEFNLNSGPNLNLINNLNLGIQDNITIPRYIPTLSYFGLLNKVNLLRDKTYQSIRENATTNIGAGYNFQRTINFIDISTFNLSYGYNYSPDNDQSFSFRQIGLNLNQYNRGSLFPTNNPLLDLSFVNNLFTGILFREVAYRRKWTRGQQGRNTFRIFSSFEQSGLEIYGINKAVNAFTGDNNIWEISQDLSFANFLRFELEGAFEHRITPGTTLASRSYFGIVVPYGDDLVAPYIKQFDVGGPNSLRAWQSRELGPGGFNEFFIAPLENQLFFQAGDLKLELNLEYRFDIIWYLEGAFFIDAGNIWTLQEDPNRPNARFTSGFLNQFAIGAGWGLRLDVDYTVFRIDFGYPIRNPYTIGPPVSQKHWVWDVSGFGNLTFGVNYPF